MPKTVRAHHSLQEEAKQRLQRHLDAAPGLRRRVLWWDAGGHLQSLLRQVCQDLGVPFVAREHPLGLRQWVAEQGETPEAEPERVLWYVPEAKRDRNWFRDVEATGGIIEKSIEDLAADLYGIQSWQLRPWQTDETVSESVAAKLDDELHSGGGMPILERLQGRILTGDDSRPVEYILRSGWGDLPRSDEVVGKIQALLSEEHVPHIEAEDGPSQIVQKVRRWAVAGWLNQAGLPEENFPEPIASSHLAYAYRRQASVLKTDPQTDVLSRYQTSFWPEVIGDLDDPWALVECPVDGTLEERLWTTWLAGFDAERFDTCRERVGTRIEVLHTATGRADKPIGKSSPAWIRVWRQAASLADLARRYETWDERNVPAHALYADRKASLKQSAERYLSQTVRRIQDDLAEDREARTDRELQRLDKYAAAERARLQSFIEDYRERQEAGADMEIAIRGQETRLQNLEARIQERKDNVREKGRVVSLAPELVNVCYTFPN